MGITGAMQRLFAGGGRNGAARATWNGIVLAESDRTVIVEGNHYFPPDDVNFDYLEPSSHHSVCPWKGVASYYDAVVDGERNRNAAWYYSNPSSAAESIKDHVAFWHGVRVTKEPRADTRSEPA